MKALEIAKLPFDALAVLSGAKSFERNIVLGSERLNRRGLHRWRVEQAARMAERRRSRLARVLDGDDRTAFDRDGFVVIEDFLPRDLFREVLQEVESAFDRFDMVQGAAVTRRAMIDDRDLLDRPALREARDDGRMRDLVRYAASASGTPLTTLQIVFARTATPEKGRRVDPQTVLHSDTFHATAKAWLFLRDVGPDDGPFSYVPGSHRMTAERIAWEDELASHAKSIENVYAARGSLRVRADQLGSLGYADPRAVTVRANTLVVADTHGFHARTASARPTTRVEIYSSLRRNPFLPWMGGHTASLAAGRMNRAMIDALALAKRSGLRGSPWRAKGVGPIDEWPSEL